MNLKDQNTADGRSPAINAIIPALLGLLLLFTPLGEGLVRLSYNLPFLLRVDRFTDGVAVVQLDTESATRLQQPSSGPWDRALHGRFLQKMASWKARAVVMVVPFDQPSTNDTALAQAAAACGHVVFAASGRSGADSARRGGSVIPPSAEFQRAAAWGIPSFEETEAEPGRCPDENSSEPTLALKAAQITRPTPPVVPETARWLNFYGPPGAIP